jgi:hypothetical protein
VVVTSWEWSTEKKYLHDLISSDRRNPTVNAYGPLYGSPEYSTDDMPMLDPKTNKVTFFKLPVKDPNMPESLGPPLDISAGTLPTAPSAYWGDEKIWDTRANRCCGAPLLLYDLISPREQRRRHIEPEGLRGLQVDHQLVSGRGLNWKIARLLAFENAIDVGGPHADTGLQYQAHRSSALRW